MKCAEGMSDTNIYQGSVALSVKYNNVMDNHENKGNEKLYCRNAKFLGNPVEVWEIARVILSA